MSNKKKSKKNVETYNSINNGIILGLLGGVILGGILLLVFDNLFFFGIAPICGLFIGLLISSLLDKNKKLINHNLKKAKAK